MSRILTTPPINVAIWSSLLSVMTETIRTVLFGAMHLCVTIYIRFQVITQHVRTRFGRAAFEREITSFGSVREKT